MTANCCSAHYENPTTLQLWVWCSLPASAWHSSHIYRLNDMQKEQWLSAHGMANSTPLLVSWEVEWAEPGHRLSLCHRPSHLISLLPAAVDAGLDGELVGCLTAARQGQGVTTVLEAAQVARHCRKEKRVTDRRTDRERERKKGLEWHLYSVLLFTKVAEGNDSEEQREQARFYMK